MNAAEPTTEPLIKRKDGGVLWLSLNRPSSNNSFTVPIIDGLHAALGEAAKDGSIKVLVITGNGRAFCAGQDLKEHLERKPEFIDELRLRYNPLILKIRKLPKPVIAAVNGTAAGAGMSLALACDFRLCTPETQFHTSFIKIGLVPDSGNLLWLGKQIGFARALELEMTGAPITADQAAAWGLVNRVVEAGKLAEETAAFARSLAEGPSVALALTKEMYNQALFAQDLPTQLDSEALMQQVAGKTKDHAEGLAAFLEKRKPRFTGE